MILDILTYNIHGLPWSRDHTRGICEFLMNHHPSVICLQEVFHDVNRKFYRDFFNKIGYHVCIPNDSDVGLLPSGLLTAWKKSDFILHSECFYSFEQNHNFEMFANKGFHVMCLYHMQSKQFVRIVNTHTQSDTLSYIFGKNATQRVREKQSEQMVKFLKPYKSPILIIGDFNCEKTPIKDLHFLHPPGTFPLKKRTFYSTGEELDQLACLCDRPYPRIISCRIFDQPWSDHAPVRFHVEL
jgi:exonuclease III